ncbi:MAG: HD-GYP domain-containing protein [Candidatus Omnitrophota bacterium]
MNYKTTIPIIFTFLIIGYTYQAHFNPDYLSLVITRVFFPLMVAIIGIIWYKENATTETLKETRVNLEIAKEQIKEGYLSAVKSLALAIEAKDLYTRGHSARVVKYALAIAEGLGLSEKEKEVIRNAGILHDIGKIAISDQILGKKDKLTEEEFDTIKKHPALGENILKPLSFLDTEASIILSHHERIDGKGYHKLSHEDIPLASKILIIVDSYDAMTSDRPYRKALPKEQALQELKNNAGTQFDPHLVEVFIQVLGKMDAV